MAGKKTQGRKKIKMRKIENDGARRITFSKRRSGLFKKASELSTLCGVHIAIIVYSIGGKAFSFGHPSVESLINRFNNAYQPQQDYITRFANSIREVRLGVLNRKINDLNDKIAQERKKTKMLRKMFKKHFKCQSFRDYIDNLGSDKLQQVKEKMQLLKDNLIHGVKQRVAHRPNLSSIEQIEDIGSPIPQDWLKL